jgi:hypothetical protein
MQDQPTAAELLEIVAQFMREELVPQLSPHSAFNARVAANAVDIVRRELLLAPASNAAETTRLSTLLGRTDSLEALTRELCARIATGEIGLGTPGLADHLWQTTLDKLAIDQPNYAAYRAALAPTDAAR